MFEIKGKFSNAICYATIIEDKAKVQIKRMCDSEFATDSKIRIMPDVHAGKSCTIGTTMTVTDKVVPNIVGFDIGCGMYTVEIGNVTVDFPKVDEAAHIIPSGMNVWNGDVKQFDFLLYLIDKTILFILLRIEIRILYKNNKSEPISNKNGFGFILFGAGNRT